ncbi:MAG: hypothetical protein ACC661_11115, partial [Verrucomicrobiales bacterium]
MGTYAVNWRHFSLLPGCHNWGIVLPSGMGLLRARFYLPATLGAAALALLASAPRDVDAAPRKFTDTQGREIIAELVSGDSEYVELRRGDRTIRSLISLFSKPDQAYIRQWIEAHPRAIDYHFDIGVDRKQLERDISDGGYKRVKRSTWVYHVSIESRTRETVSDLVVEYRAFMEDRVSGDYPSSSPETVMKKGDFNLPELKYNHSAEFTTESFQLDLVDYDYSFSGRNRTKDEL